MSDKSHIEWTDATWNPTTGCTKVSEGCRHCYIDRTPAFRIGSKPKNGELIPPRRFDSEEIGGTTGVMVHPERLEQPLKWKRPRRIFVNSLSDLFHESVPNGFIAAVFTIMAMSPQHSFQVLTKRPRRMRDLLTDPTFVRNVLVMGTRWLSRDAIERQLTMGENGQLPGRLPLPNVWLGTSVEDQKAADLRIPLLLETPAAVRFLSCEPLLGPVDLSTWLGVEFMESLDGWGEEMFAALNGQVGGGLHWIIVGGESGPKARPMHPEWARSLRDQCVAASVPFFFKQWGEYQPGWFGGKEVFVQRDGTVWKGRQLDVYGVEEPCAVMRRLGKKHAGRELDGRTWDEMPELVRA